MIKQALLLRIKTVKENLKALDDAVLSIPDSFDKSHDDNNRMVTPRMMSHIGDEIFELRFNIERLLAE